MFKSLRMPLFNAESDMGGGGSDPVISSSAEFTPAWGLPQGGDQAAASNPLLSQEPASPVPQQEPVAAGQVFDFAGRKIEVVDPAIAAALKDVHKDYSALQSTYTQTSQRMKEMEQANQTYLNLLNTQQQQGQQNVPQPQQPAQPSQEDIEQMKADFMEQFYDNPRTAIEGMLESMFQQRVQPIIEPITQERQFNEQIAALQQKYPDDFATLVGPMQELLKEMPHLAEHGLEGVFQIAKRAQPAPQPAAPTPEQLLNDPQFVQQMMQHPDIQKQFLTQYMQEKQGSQQQAPTMMGAQPGGQMPSTPENRPKDIRSATQAFKRSLGIL